MSEKAFAELAKLDLSADEIAFVFLEISAMAVKTSRHMLIIDPADFFNTKDVLTLGKVNAILITHEHYDHFNVSGTLELQKATGATVVCNPGTYASLNGKIEKEKLKVLEAGETLKVDGIKVTALESVHPGSKPLVFLVDSNGTNFFHGSDSGYPRGIEKHKGRARVAFVPVGTPSPTASVGDAVRMVKALGSEKAVPIHGSGGEASEFKEKIGGEMPKVQVVIPKPSKVHKL